MPTNTLNATLVLCSLAASLTACEMEAPGPDDGFAGDGKADTLGISCEDLGGQCLTSIIDVGFAPNCALEFGMDHGEGSCQAFNESCCVPATAPTCEELGGQCVGAIFEELGASCDWFVGLDAEPAGTCTDASEVCCVGGN